jgi:LPPG:FO 2-phospho-L-lactate transferase
MNARVLALSGGVGGAKLAHGLSRVLAPEELLIVANTGDDFEHLGLSVCPDLDSVMYAMAGVNDTERGWGLAGESWQFMQQLRALNGEDWFQLGDKDLATHVLRSALLREGASLSVVTQQLSQALGLQHTLLPMSDDGVETMVDTDEGELSFQHYFVRRQCEPAVRSFRFRGIETARPQPAMLECLGSDALQAVVICPSNPFVSVEPILALPGMRDALRRCSKPIVAVSPLIQGQALKGPAAKMMAELNMPQTALAVAQHYQGLVTHFVLDEADSALAAAVSALGMQAICLPSIMRSLADKEALAAGILNHLSISGSH